MQDQSQADESINKDETSQSRNNHAKEGKVPSKWSRQARETSPDEFIGSSGDKLVDSSSQQQTSTAAPGAEKVATKPAPSHSSDSERKEDYERQNGSGASAKEANGESSHSTVPASRIKPGTLVPTALVCGLLIVVLAGVAAYFEATYSDKQLQENRSSPAQENRPLEQVLEPVNAQIEKNPRDEKTYFRRAEIYYDYDQPENALRDLNKAIEINPKYWLAYSLRADVASYQGLNTLAIADANRVVKEAPNEAWAWEKAGHRAKQDGMVRSGANCCRARFEDQRPLGLAMGEIATSMSGRNRYAQAVDWLTREEKLYEPYPAERTISSCGLEKFHLGDYDGCIADQNAAIKATPHRGTDLLIRAMAEAQEGDVAEAKADVAQGLEEERNPARAHRCAGDVYRLLNNFDKAISEYSIAISLFPKGSTHYRSRAVLYYRTGKLHNALADLQTAVQNKPTSTTLSYLALVEEELGQTAQADADIARAAKASMPLSIFYSNRASIKLKRGQLSEALADAQESVKLDGRNADAYEVLGRVYKAQSQETQAQVFLEKAKQLGFPRTTPPVAW